MKTTTSVTITFKEALPEYIPEPMFITLRDKIKDMFFEGKTDFDMFFVDKFTTKRRFVTEEHANEWVAFMQAEAAKHNIVLTNVEVIVDAA